MLHAAQNIASRCAVVARCLQRVDILVKGNEFRLSLFNLTLDPFFQPHKDVPIVHVSSQIAERVLILAFAYRRFLMRTFVIFAYSI
ncbi:hypothetical protein BURKHO8Y_20165 [Burkholderia sp. 8Y]|nr:hypothetical protein BURKHO8Y_20165 [Burkholderia sp. 8Y]